MAKIVMPLAVLRVGSGTFTDEKTGEVKPWANLFALGNPQTNDMFTGIPLEKIAIVDEKGNPSLAIASQLKIKLAGATSPIEINCVFIPITKKDQRVLAVSGIA